MKNKTQPKVYNLKYHFKQQSSGGAYVLYLYDEVTATGEFDWDTWEYKESETSAKYFRDKLDAIPNTGVIELHVNSGGGDVNEGVTIYNLLRQKSQAGCKIIGYVDGAAYSVAMDVIMACDEIHMGLGTSMFLHYPWTCACGNAEALTAVAKQLEALGTASVDLYMARAKNITEEGLREMMQKETMLDPETCLKYGFCDFVDTYEHAEPEDDPDETDEPVADPKDPEDPEDPEAIEDAKDEVIKQLRAELAQLKAEKTINVNQTLSRAFELIR